VSNPSFRLVADLLVAVGLLVLVRFHHPFHALVDGIGFLPLVLPQDFH
jgi:ABC-type sulfate transport system permease component